MTRFDPDTHHRRSIRLRGYNYAQAGLYFVTVCAQGRVCLFGDVIDAEMRLNEFGHIAAEEWARTADIRPNVTVEAFVVMPNHVHGIVAIDDGDAPGTGTLQRAPTTERFGKPTSNSIPTIVRLFKSATTKRINALRGMPGVPVWQRNYYEHIVRDEDSLHRIRQYISENPARWADDAENPAREKSQ
jgi:REP element-mobilizing transposase RayT